jgi:hypothetical protein
MFCFGTTLKSKKKDHSILSFQSSRLHISKLATIATKDVLIRQVVSLDFE